MSARSKGPQPRTRTDAKQCFYLVDETQGAELAVFRGALRALADLAGGHHRLDEGAVEIGRDDLASLYETLEQRLAAIMGDYDRRTVWIDADGTPGKVTL